MNPQQTQTPTHEEARAGLGIITNLMQQQVPKGDPQDQPQAPQTQGSAPQQEQPQEAKPEPQKEDIGAKMTEFELSMTKQMDALRQEIQASQKTEMENLKSTIIDALKEEDASEQKS